MIHTQNSLFMDVAGLDLTPEDKQLLAHPLIGGLILFSRNFKSRAQLTQLIAQARDIKSTLIIAVDHEGGRVQRFQTEFTRIPPMATLGRCFDENPYLAEQAAFAIAYLLATELITVGIDLNLSPVLDIDYGRNAVIGHRAFHRDPRVVARLGVAFLSGLTAAGMSAVAKHFPGHGYTALDSHVSSPVDARAWPSLFEQDLYPFRQFIQAGGQAIMPSHVVYPGVDRKIANFSEKWLKKVLKERLGFRGLILSDDLHMAGARSVGAMPARVLTALRAGCDCVLICNDRHGLIQTLHRLPVVSSINTSSLRATQQKRPDPVRLLQSAKQWVRQLRERS